MAAPAPNPRPWSRWVVVVIFAIAMGYLESAVVLYLRTLGDRIEPYQAPPLPPAVDFGAAEIVREAATMVMLATVGWLAGRDARSRFGLFLLSFGVWDICYYVFLVPLTGWPRSLFDWDLLFLIPVPWWGPVLAPALIASLMIVYGTLLGQFPPPPAAGRPPWLSWLAGCAGVGLALWVFQADALRVAGQGKEALQNMLPVDFRWPLFLVALALMSAPALATAWRLCRSRRLGGSI